MWKKCRRFKAFVLCALGNKWVQRKAFALHSLEKCLALKQKHTAGSLNANKESDLFQLSFPCASPAGSGLFEYRLTQVEYDLQKPPCQTQAAPVSSALVIYPLRSQILRTSSLGNEWHPHGWKCICSIEEVNISVIGMIQVIFLKGSITLSNSCINKTAGVPGASRGLTP